MHCKHCGFANGEDDHRCLRCGRRIGIAIAAPTAYSGANALAVAPDVSVAVERNTQPLFSNTASLAGKQTALRPAPAQPSLFPSATVPHAKIIPFNQSERLKAAGSMAQEGSDSEMPRIAPQRVSPAKKPATSSPEAEQTRIDFVPASSNKARASNNNVEAVIFCEQQVALPMHRFVGACIDAALIFFAFGLFLTIFLGMGGNFGEGKMFWIVMASSFAIVALFYGSIWGIMGRETPGMQCVGLELITFDGTPVEGQARLLRFGATALSFCSAGLGLLWSLVDEEKLAWQDHISKTFPAVQERPRNFVRR